MGFALFILLSILLCEVGSCSCHPGAWEEGISGQGRMLSWKATGSLTLGQSIPVTDRPPVELSNHTFSPSSFKTIVILKLAENLTLAISLSKNFLLGDGTAGVS